MSLLHFLHIVKNFTCSAFKKYQLTKELYKVISYVSHLSSFSVKSIKSVQNVQSRQVKCGLREQIWCSMFKVDRCSMYPGSLPLNFNGSVPGHEKLFNVHRCSIGQVPLYIRHNDGLKMLLVCASDTGAMSDETRKTTMCLINF